VIADVSDDLVLLSILRKSASDLQRCLDEVTLEDDSRLLLHFSCLWPQGLRLLLSHNVCTNLFDELGQSALDWALFECHYGNFSREDLHDAVTLLLGSSVPITENTWYAVLQTQDETLILGVAREIWRREQSLAPCFSRFGIPYSAKLKPYSSCPSLYHFPLTTTIAESLFQLGVDSIDRNANCLLGGSCQLEEHRWSNGTPLWNCVDKVVGYRTSNEYFEYAQWLVEKGARLSTVHPVAKVMTLHRLIDEIVYSCVVH
jgi:hypothetical protein